MLINKILLFTLSIVLFVATRQSNAQQKRSPSTDDLDIFSMIRPIPATNIFIDSVYNIWCGSVIKGKNGKYYMFYSRWPRKKGHYAWVNESEVALAVSEKPGGPYKHVKTILKARGNRYWDGACTHNPYAIAYKGKYYLYYMGTTGSSKLREPASMADPNWWEYRNNQRIGVAVADDPEGKWVRYDRPVLDVSTDSAAFDALMVSNPAVTANDKGRILLIYKCVAKNATLRGGQVRFGAAFSDSPMGPFRKNTETVFDFKDQLAEKSHMLAEDPFIWFSQGKYFAIVRDVVDYFNKGKSTLALLSSPDGLHWQPARHPAVAPYGLQFADGSVSKDQIERPWLLLENGKPIILFGAMGINKREHSMNIAVPLQKSHP
jgi:hypothetical protein